MPVPGQPEVAPGNPGEPHSTLSGCHQRGRSRPRGIVSGSWEVHCNERRARWRAAPGTFETCRPAV